MRLLASSIEKWKCLRPRDAPCINPMPLSLGTEPAHLDESALHPAVPKPALYAQEGIGHDA